MVDDKSIQSVDHIEYHRVIDNAAMSMPMSDFWIQLNYQLIHILDFVPTCHWGNNPQDNVLFHVAMPLLRLLREAGQLVATVDLDMSSCSPEADGQVMSLVAVLSVVIPNFAKLRIQQKQFRRFSQKI